MKSVFISYRRKDTADIAGRLFDRLSGYFGPGSTLLDVDALVAGGSYRTQIERLIERCSVVLAVIGREWLTVTDDSGRRRLDNPDDQLRIEIAVALKSGRTVIPILVHEAALPTAAELPDELQALAACEPHVMQSGAPFNADMQFLLERLQGSGLRPPESAFPWQAVLIPAGISVLLFGMFNALDWFGVDRDNDFVVQQLDPAAPIDQIRFVGDYELKGPYALSLEPFDVARFDRRTWGDAWRVMLPLGLGPLLIVWGMRRCCLSKERTSAKRHYAQGAGRLPMPKSGKSVVCLALGLASFGFGALSAIPALIVGAWAWLDIRRHLTWIRGRSLIVVGVLASLAGLWMTWFVYRDVSLMRSWIVAMQRANELASEESEDGDEAAFAEFDAAVRLNPDNSYAVPVTRMIRGELRRLRGEPEEALGDLIAAIDALPPTLDDMGPYQYHSRAVVGMAYAIRADVYEALSRPDEAAADRQQDTRDVIPPSWQPPAGDGLAPEPPPGEEVDLAPARSPAAQLGGS